MIFNHIFNYRVENPPPIWFMRQAGRYLPEYQKLRMGEPDFMKFCFSPELIIESTLQPINRFDFDAAILFSDILTIPHLLGQTVSFTKGYGPQLHSYSTDILKHELSKENYSPILDAIAELRTKLSPKKALFGFSGAPWTLATYMVEEGKSENFNKVKNLAKQKDVGLTQLIEHLIQQVARILTWQLKSGCDVVQIFDSWAGVLSKDDRHIYCYDPLKKIISLVRCAVPNAKIIYFAKGACKDYELLLDLDIAFGVDYETSMCELDEKLPRSVILQGNLSPHKLVIGDIEEDIRELKKIAKQRPFIFNLGHGILPNTPIAHVEKAIQLMRDPDEE